MCAAIYAEVPTTTKDELMQTYLAKGERKAMALGNRGPIRFNPDDTLHEDIVAVYWRVGFYVFEGVTKADELEELRADVRDLLDRLPTRKNGTHHAKGRTALGVGCTAPT